jgi:hypothetical protein
MIVPPPFPDIETKTVYKPTDEESRAIQAALGITVPRGTPESPPDADTIVQDISPEAPAEPYKETTAPEPKPAPKELVQAEFTCKTCGETTVGEVMAKAIEAGRLEQLALEAPKKVEAAQ